MAKSLREQMLARGLVSAQAAHEAEAAARERDQRVCENHASMTTANVRDAFKNVIIEYRHHRGMGGKQTVKIDGLVNDLRRRAIGE